jgi:hypothetical protein
MMRGRKKVTRNGRKTAVTVSMGQSKRKTKRKTKRVGTLADCFASSPLRTSPLEVKRSKDKLRLADSRAFA